MKLINIDLQMMMFNFVFPLNIAKIERNKDFLMYRVIDLRAELETWVQILFQAINELFHSTHRFSLPRKCLADAFKVLTGKPKGNRLLGMPRTILDLK